MKPILCNFVATYNWCVHVCNWFQMQVPGTLGVPPSAINMQSTLGTVALYTEAEGHT